MQDFIISTLVSVAVGAVVFAVAVRMLRIPATIDRILTLSFAPIMFAVPVSLVLGILLSNYLLVALLVLTVFQASVAAFMLRIQAISQRCEVTQLRSYAVGLVYAVSSTFLASWLSGLLLESLGHSLELETGRKTMWIALAIIGWLAFALILWLYRVGNKINARDENALALYSLCLMFEDNFREGNAGGFRKFVEEQKDEDSSKVTFWLLGAIKKSAISYSLPSADPINTFGLADHCVRKIVAREP